ncbi:MAG: hypothetical protein CME26_12870 [Gemmatimonadetes bacterium]|nr:hypothetical protein [Gemmatimonadota bacterium]|tara:strand:- start:378 stop:1130 length:753 start_codon:yes stop_codon:yes gene_type:complete
MRKILSVGLVTATLFVFGGAMALPEATYTIHRAGTPITVDGRLDEPAWVGAPSVGAFVFPWYEAGKKEQTVAKLLWDDEHLYAAFICEDAHISAEHTERDSEVWKDDTVEVFTAPDPDRPQMYFNLEMNVLGIFLDQFHPEGPGVPVEEEWNADGVRISTTVVGTLNDDSDEDEYWILEAAIPFANFREVAKHTPPEPGDVWRLNLNRLGGKTNQQFSQWTPSQADHPQFHSPDDFGRVTFSSAASPFHR